MEFKRICIPANDTQWKHFPGQQNLEPQFSTLATH